MPQLLVRNIEARVVKKLRLKAARDGVSVEEEHRRILRDALMGSAPKKKKASPPKMNFKEFLLSAPPDPEFARILEKIVRDRKKDRMRDIDW